MNVEGIHKDFLFFFLGSKFFLCLGLDSFTWLLLAEVFAFCRMYIDTVDSGENDRGNLVWGFEVIGILRLEWKCISKEARSVGSEWYCDVSALRNVADQVDLVSLRVCVVW